MYFDLFPSKNEILYTDVQVLFVDILHFNDSSCATDSWSNYLSGSWYSVGSFADMADMISAEHSK